jgi:hypothetical protein
VRGMGHGCTNYGGFGKKGLGGIGWVSGLDRNFEDGMGRTKQGQKVLRETLLSVLF